MSGSGTQGKLPHLSKPQLPPVVAWGDGVTGRDAAWEAPGTKQGCSNRAAVLSWQLCCAPRLGGAVGPLPCCPGVTAQRGGLTPGIKSPLREARWSPPPSATPTLQP